MEKAGVIYILTNPPFPEYVKIGYADDVEKRLVRQEQSHSNSIVGVRFFYFCIKGIAGFVVPTQKIKYTQTHYLNQKRNEFGDFCK